MCEKCEDRITPEDIKLRMQNDPEFKKSVTEALAKTAKEELRKQKKALSDASVLQKRIIKRIGRNKPCPCGSKKKFKKCCMPKG